MTLLGQTRQDLPFPVCSQFKPVVFEGQFCYSLDLASLNLEVETKSHKEHGLLMIIDPSQSMDYPFKNNIGSSKVNHFETLNMKIINNVQNSASIHIHTLGRFSDSRAGSYVLTTPKWMTGTQSFLELSDDKKGCQNEDFDNCRVEAFANKVLNKCKCLPWHLAGLLKQKVTQPITFKTLMFLSGRSEYVSAISFRLLADTCPGQPRLQGLVYRALC